MSSWDLHNRTQTTCNGGGVGVSVGVAGRGAHKSHCETVNISCPPFVIEGGDLGSGLLRVGSNSHTSNAAASVTNDHVIATVHAPTKP
jgi:hypothetical protein